jgi:hypothetical protein
MLIFYYSFINPFVKLISSLSARFFVFLFSELLFPQGKHLFISVIILFSNGTVSVTTRHIIAQSYQMTRPQHLTLIDTINYNV